MKVIVPGKLMEIVRKQDFKNREMGQLQPQKPLLQIMSEMTLDNGFVKMNLQDIFILDEIADGMSPQYCSNILEKG